jgi:hypothetical protein
VGVASDDGTSGATARAGEDMRRAIPKKNPGHRNLFSDALVPSRRRHATVTTKNDERASVEEAAMPTDEAALAEARQANERYRDDYERRLAAEIVALLPEDRDDALRVLATAHAILDLELPPPSEG